MFALGIGVQRVGKYLISWKKLNCVLDCGAPRICNELRGNSLFEIQNNHFDVIVLFSDVSCGFTCLS